MITRRRFYHLQIATLAVGFLTIVNAFSRLSYHQRFARTRILTPRDASNNEIPFFAEETNASNGVTAETVVIAGATGYIGRAVVQESVKRGYNTVALVRDKNVLTTPEGLSKYKNSFQGATIAECDVSNLESLKETLSRIQASIVVSCLASPSGTKQDAYAIDYQATLNCLHAGQHVNARHFVLLSAFCCRKPLLQLQQAKLKMEAALQEQSDLTWTIVRPTAFFKSVSGQLEAIKAGSPYVLFGDGAVTRCNPIAESELAEFMLDSLLQEEKQNVILNVGGPDQPLTNKMLGEMMFEAVGNENPKFVYAPTGIFDYVIDTLQFLAILFKSEALEDAAETARIGKYYAVEDMLTTHPDEKYGKITMQEHYTKIARQGQDPFTPVRATAAIGRVLELVPFVSIGAPVLYALSRPLEMATAQSSPVGGISMMIASLKNYGVHW